MARKPPEKKTKAPDTVRITPSKRVTMTDVARLAGCSQSTVSVVLNNTPGILIAKDTRRRVAQAVQQLGYIHSRSAEAVGHRPHQIALIFDHIATSPEAAVAFDGAWEAASRSGYIVAAYQTLNDEHMEPRTIAAANISTVDAVIYATIMTREVTLPKALYNLRKPLVLLNCYSTDRTFPSVLPGEVAGGHLATRTLTQAGHKRIAHITGEMWMDAAKSRLKGYRQALASAEIPYDATLVRKGNWQTSSGYEHTKTLMDLDEPPTAIFCSNDRMAVGCYEALKERGLHIPEDVSVVGYDDEEVARHMSPPLTSLILPHREMGVWAVEHTLESPKNQREGEQFPLVKLECTLVERESVTAPRTAPLSSKAKVVTDHKR